MTSTSAARVVTENLGGSRLSMAVQEGRLPAGLQVAMPRGIDEWRRHVQRARDRVPTGWFDALRPAIAPGSAASARLERVVKERGVVVTTGQQAALFGGPLYTLAKALGALALADVLERQTGIATAPVFWAATDDADFAEAATTYAADAKGLHELSLRDRPASGTIMAHFPLRGTQALLESLLGASGSAAHAQFFELTQSAFRDGVTLGDAYVSMLRSLLEPLGIAVMDSGQPAYRKAARPLLVEALRRGDDVARAVTDASSAIRRAGFEPQVEDDRGLSLVFAVEEGIKRRIALGAARGAETSSAELAPNVLLRPVVERALLPTVAYVAGPGELAYFSQSNAVAEALGHEPIVGTPRWSCTVVESFAARALERLGVEYRELSEPHAIEARFARASLPEGVAAGLERLRQDTTSAIRELRETALSAGLVPAAMIDGIERALAHRISRAERRLLAAAKRRNEQVRRDLAVARAAFYPNGTRQERVLNFVPMLARGGEDLLDEMRRAALAHAESRVVASSAPEPAVR